jgi:hypothetical protein
MADVLKAHIRDRRVRFVTLTRRHSHAPLADQIDAVYEAFARLRRRAWWKDRVTGGAAFLEVKLSDRDGLWHPHLHLIVEGTFIPQRELSMEWLGVTCDSSIVDVRDCPTGDHSRVAAYVTKYVTKPASGCVYHNPEKLLEMMAAMKGRRLCLTFSSWRGLKLNDPPDPNPGKVWKPVGSIEQLARRAREGDERALRYWAAALRKWPSISCFGGPPCPGSTPAPVHAPSESG